MPAKELVIIKVTSSKPKTLPKNEFLDLGILNNLQMLNLKPKIKSSRGVSNARKNKQLKTKQQGKSNSSVQ